MNIKIVMKGKKDNRLESLCYSHQRKRQVFIKAKVKNIRILTFSFTGLLVFERQHLYNIRL